MLTLRHVCGEIINVFYAEGPETIVQFFDRFDRNGEGEEIHVCPKCDNPLTMAWLGNPWLVEPMPLERARQTRDTMHCSGCWSNYLEYEEVRDVDGNVLGYRPYCHFCLEETVGFVSGKFISWARDKDWVAMFDARPLHDLLFNVKPAPKLTEAESIKALGF